MADAWDETEAASGVRGVDEQIAAHHAVLLCAMLREVGARALQDAHRELLEAEREAAAAHDRLDAARAAVLEWVERCERAARLTAEVRGR